MISSHMIFQIVNGSANFKIGLQRIAIGFYPLIKVMTNK